MEIKTSEGTQHVTSSGQGALNTVLGAVGTAGALLGGGGIASGLFSGNQMGAKCVTEAEMAYFQQSVQKDQELARKDSEIAILKSENFTNTKIVDAYTVLRGEIRRVEDKVDANRAAQDSVNMQQATYNASANGTISTLAAQVAQLQNVTKLFVPSSNVCKQCCSGCGCGYEA